MRDIFNHKMRHDHDIHTNSYKCSGAYHLPISYEYPTPPHVNKAILIVNNATALFPQILHIDHIKSGLFQLRQELGLNVC